MGAASEIPADADADRSATTDVRHRPVRGEAPHTARADHQRPMGDRVGHWNVSRAMRPVRDVAVID